MPTRPAGAPWRSAEPRQGSATVALLAWGNVLEEFLDTIGVSLETFCREFKGSWMFGYIAALQRAGVETVLMCVTARVSTPTHFTHGPTGATICLLPAPRAYRAIRARMRNPYGRTVRQAFGEMRGARRLLVPALAVLREVVLYLTTPVRALGREVRAHGCQAILCQEYEQPRFDVSVALGRLIGVPVFASFQGGDYQRSRLERFSRPLALRGCAGLIIGTGTEIDRVRSRYRVPPAKIARIFNPVDVATWDPMDRGEARRALGIPPDAEVVAWHGRVAMEQKGLDVLLDAWERVRGARAGRDLRLILVGTGRDVERLRQRLATIEPRSVMWVNAFVHDRSAIRRYLSSADVYAFPSRVEGFPVSPLEAMSCALPVVAADANGIPDILEGNEAAGGVIVPRGDAVALAREIGRLLDDVPASRELGLRARRRIESLFSLDAVGAQLRAVLLRQG
jgi:glycosyltransferase involved in cell wall biosynthesis